MLCCLCCRKFVVPQTWLQADLPRQRRLLANGHRRLYQHGGSAIDLRGRRHGSARHCKRMISAFRLNDILDAPDIDRPRDDALPVMISRPDSPARRSRHRRHVRPTRLKPAIGDRRLFAARDFTINDGVAVAAPPFNRPVIMHYGWVDRKGASNVADRHQTVSTASPRSPLVVLDRHADDGTGDPRPAARTQYAWIWAIITVFMVLGHLAEYFLPA